MSDVHTKEQRSRNMSAIRGRYNKSTEIAVLKLFRKSRMKGWRRHPKRLPGTPDFVFPGYKIAIFLDGCFWHGCPKCKLCPGTNKRFWNAKIRTNRKRDSAAKKQLTGNGWKVLRFWEHDIKNNPNKVINRIKNAL